METKINPSQYTKGKWEIRNAQDWEIYCGNQIVAFCPKGYPEANAHLIVLAPALYEVLKAICERMAIQNRIRNASDGEPLDTPSDDILFEQALKVLAKVG